MLIQDTCFPRMNQVPGQSLSYMQECSGLSSANTSQDHMCEWKGTQSQACMNKYNKHVVANQLRTLIRILVRKFKRIIDTCEAKQNNDLRSCMYVCGRDN